MNKLDTWHKSLLVSHMKDQHMVLKRYLKFITCKLLWYLSLKYIFLEIYYKLKTRTHNLCVLWHWKYKEIRNRFIYLFIYLFVYLQTSPWGLRNTHRAGSTMRSRKVYTSQLSLRWTSFEPALLKYPLKSDVLLIETSWNCLSNHDTTAKYLLMKLFICLCTF